MRLTVIRTTQDCFRNSDKRTPTNSWTGKEVHQRRSVDRAVESVARRCSESAPVPSNSAGSHMSSEDRVADQKLDPARGRQHRAWPPWSLPPGAPTGQAIDHPPPCFHLAVMRFYCLEIQVWGSETSFLYVRSVPMGEAMPEPSTRTVERALTLLANVCAGSGVNLIDAARDADLATSTAMRLLRTLEKNGFVRRDNKGLYRAGGRMMQVGAQALSNEALVDLCRPTMEQMVGLTGESAYLSVPGHSQTALYIGIVEGTHSVRHANWVGRTVALTTSAVGKVLVGPIPPTDYIVVESGIESDVTAVAAPVRSGGRTVAAMSLVIPSYRVDEVKAHHYGHLLAQATKRVSNALGIT